MADNDNKGLGLQDSLFSWINNHKDAHLYLGILLERIPALVSLVADDGRVLFASRQHTFLAGVADHLVNIEQEADLYPALIWDRVYGLKQQPVDLENEQVWELSVKHKDGSLHQYQMRRFIVESQSADSHESHSAIALTYTIGVDITEHRTEDPSVRDQSAHINYVTFHDPLTGLANRSLFYDRMHKSLSRAKRNDSSLAIILLDLDRFKNINDSLGHDAGDACLKHVARHLVEELRDTDTVARLGGDEFVVVLENVNGIEVIEKIASKLLDCLAQPITIQNHEIASTASMGISIFPKDGDSIDQLLKHADTAMYRAKAAGKNRYQFYLSAMSDTAVNYLLLENDLRRALEQDELCLYYQPQIDLNTGRIIGLEALVRWQHKDRGLVSPIHFIPLAEETGLIEPLGAWVLERACVRFQSWLLNDIHLGKIAVNLSTRQLRQGDFADTVAQILSRTGLPPEYLELEITETSAMENAADTIEMLTTLSGMGLSLAIDDFGTGYSSLAYLQRFPIQKLKIDRSFIDDIDRDKQDSAIAKSIIDLAHNMSLQVIAEGVERPAQSRWLIDRGCDQVQGFYYSKPLSEEQLMTLVNDRTRVIRDLTGVRLIL
ncbi:putative bifunctional diguanylate cyclase/phosphodiesterase [Teredinibacter purpureus]|jgi:diguanylate cyclase (GGDEF) domain|uniref:putative bifunctional diguanylate cyclase/phosphodiesterase n=1 Tax=Teredinibacter purpureus TaxID=2731756 RepID=UPI0006970B62|nr:EAL domain-containing protein [Teredinibacter purpureus]